MQSATQLEAQDPTRAALAKNFDHVAGFLIKSAELVPESQYGERPVNTVRTFLQQIAHVVDANRYYHDSAKGPNAQWVDAVEQSATSKSEVVTLLKQSIDACRAVYNAPDSRFDQLIENIGHANLHYGNVITYLRVMGFTPPSS
jgi:hypothetical protein